MSPRSTRRIVVTGLGLITPLGTGVEKTWKAICAGESGIGRITKFDPAAYDAQIAGEVKDFDPAEFIEKKEIKKMDTFIHYAVAAAQLAVDDAGFAFAVAVGLIGSLLGRATVAPRIKLPNCRAADFGRIPQFARATAWVVSPMWCSQWSRTALRRAGVDRHTPSRRRGSRR